MTDHREHFVDAGGRRCRVWEGGTGPKLFWLAPAPLLYRWTAIHEALAARAHLIMCALPGMAGNGRNHDDLDDHLSWVIAAQDLLVAAGFAPGDTLMGSSTAGALAADVAAIWPDLVGRLILTAPHGLFDEAEPTRDMYALNPRTAAEMLSARPDLYKAQIAAPEDWNPVLWGIEVYRSNEAAARLLWPLSDTGVAKRLGRITADTLILWGADDRIIPPTYSARFAARMTTAVDVRMIEGGGHLVEIDEPEAVAAAVLEFVGASAEVARPRVAAG